MSAPNLASPTSLVNGKTAVYAVTSSNAAALSNAGGSGKCLRIEAVYATSVHSSTTWVTLTLYRSSMHYRIAYQLSIPVTGSFNILGGRILYLEEGDALYMQAQDNTQVEAVIPYEEMA